MQKSFFAVLVTFCLILLVATLTSSCAVVPAGHLDGAAETAARAETPPVASGGGTSQVQEQHRPGDEAPPPGQLTAGEWRDLDHWSFWLGLFDQASEHGQHWGQYEAHWGFYTRRHYSVLVRAEGEPAADVLVELLDENQEIIWRTRTDNRGRAELINGAFGAPSQGPLSVVASSGDVTAVLSPLEEGPQGRRHLDLDTAAEPENILDLMFVIDTTGSMGDELSYLQAEFRDTIERISSKADPEMTLRMSTVFYRDHGDLYVVRSFPFTENVERVQQQLAAQSAAGGGDIPEAVDRAMDDAIYKNEWSERARARLLFLVLDAPPNYNEPDMARLRRAIEGAAEKGVRIIPIVGSGTDVSTEFLMRTFAILTGGTYVFITDHSGIGESHLEPTVGSYEVELLNHLVVRLIIEALQ